MSKRVKGHVFLPDDVLFIRNVRVHTNCHRRSVVVSQTAVVVSSTSAVRKCQQVRLNPEQLSTPTLYFLTALHMSTGKAAFDLFPKLDEGPKGPS